LPYNQLRPIINDDELKNDHFENEGDLKNCNTGSMCVPYVGCAVLVINSNMVHPAKIVIVGRNVKCGKTFMGECEVSHMLE
jgi:hypothetical protein